MRVDPPKVVVTLLVKTGFSKAPIMDHAIKKVENIAPNCLVAFW